MKLYSKHFKKMYFIGISVIIVFTLIGVSYCVWNNSINFNHKIKSGQLILENTNEKSAITVELMDNSHDFVVPFSIKNLSTVPVREKSVILKLYDEDITKTCDIVFNNYKDNRIEGEIILDLVKINEIIMEKEVHDSSLLTEPIIVKKPLNVKMEFVQANLNDKGWNESIIFDVFISKTIMPVKNEVVVEMPPEVQLEEASEIKPETTSDAQPETTPEIKPETTSDAQPETTPEIEPETTSDAQPETTPEIEPETTSDAQPETTPEIKPETTPDAQPETTPEIEPETTPDAQPETTPEIEYTETIETNE